MATSTEMADCATRYGDFDPVTGEFAIGSPKTPYPWINFLGFDEFRSILSNTGGGYSFYGDAKLRRLTRYRYNSLPVDGVGKYLYIDDGESVWNPGWRPTQTALDHYECRHGQGYSTFTATKNGIEARLHVFVHPTLSAEVQWLELGNTRSEPRDVRVTSYVEWCLWNADDDAANLQRTLSIGEIMVDDSVIYHLTGYRERRSHYGYHAASRPVAGFDTDRDTFLGPYRGLDNPRSIFDTGPQNSIASGWAPIASLRCDLTIPAESREEVTFVTGFEENPRARKWRTNGKPNTELARMATEKVFAPGAPQAALDAVERRWSDLFESFQIDAPEPELNILINTWNPYQCMITFDLARSTSLFETGSGRGIGFRDSNQDTLGAVHMVPERVRQRLLDLAATQFHDGSAYHQYQPLTRTGNDAIGSGFNDDPLWLVLGVLSYIRETGDLDFLDELAPYEHDDSLSATMLHHVETCMRFIESNLGEHSLPLIGRADWNDCLNLNAHSDNPDESFQTAPMRSQGRAESVMIAGLYVMCCRELEDLYRFMGNLVEAERACANAQQMSDSIVEHAWNGSWFLRAYDDSGKAIGDRNDGEDRIFVESQAFCAMAGLGADPELITTALQSVFTRLSGPDGICLLDPPYSIYDPGLGEITTYPPGYKENGSVFCHTNPWIIIAEALNGNATRAMDYLRTLAPTYRTNHDVRRTEPYVYPQMVAGPSAGRPGEAKNSWLTGTASWAYVAVTQYILGIRPQFDGLLIDPCIPEEWPEYRVTRKFRGAIFDIHVHNTGNVSSGVRSIRVDGELIDGKTIPPAAEGSRVAVQVDLG